MTKFQYIRFAAFALATTGLAACARDTAQKSESETGAQEEMVLGGPSSKFTANAKIVRGLNATACIGKNVKNGAENKPTKATDDMDNLSVNCAESSSVSFADLFATGSTAQWTTTLGNLRSANSNVTLVADPLPGNKKHCLISNISANEFCSKGKVQ